MRNVLAPVLILAAFPLCAHASEKPPSIYFGADVGMPYTLRIDSTSHKGRGNMNLGVDGRYFLDENLNLGGRFAFDLQKRGGSTRQITFAPGLQYRWLSTDRFSPYFRADIPVVLHGAANNAGSSGKMDVGISTGFGLAWNLGGAMGVPNAAIRYDFGLEYLLGLGAAVNILAIELFKFGLEYRF
jgi:hypothetical protein